MTNDDLIAAARARLDQHGACSDVMKEMKALIEAHDALKNIEPVAWLHVMTYETGETDERVTFEMENPWGVRGKHYDESYLVTTHPLIIQASGES